MLRPQFDEYGHGGWRKDSARPFAIKQRSHISHGMLGGKLLNLHVQAGGNTSQGMLASKTPPVHEDKKHHVGARIA